jgi:hypothetical protein
MSKLHFLSTGALVALSVVVACGRTTPELPTFDETAPGGVGPGSFAGAGTAPGGIGGTTGAGTTGTAGTMGKGGSSVSTGGGGPTPGTGGSVGTAGHTGTAGSATSTGGSGHGTAGTTGSGGVSTVGAGGGGPTACGGCVEKDAQNQGSACDGAWSECFSHNGCKNLFECLTENDCFGTPSPQSCAIQNGCSSSPNNIQRLRDAVGCSQCNACSGTCPMPPNGCSGGGTTTGGGPGPMVSCDQCQNLAYPKCEPILNQCYDTPDCSSLLDCFQQCDENDDQCVSVCFEKHPSAQDQYKQLYSCFVCDSCAEACMAGPECQ